MLNQLETISNSLVKDLQKSLKDKGHYATGKTAGSIRNEVRDSGFKIYGSQHIGALVFGRKPSGRKGSASEPLWKALDRWARAKGITINPYAAANKIHKFGIKVPNEFNKGKVISDVINDDWIEKISKSLLDFRSKEFKSRLAEISKTF